jgi:hypothetical protein
MAPGAGACEGVRRIGRCNMIEEFFKAHQHTIAAIAAAGTVGAVVTSLWLAWSARRADRTRLPPSSFRDRLAALEVPCVPPGPLGCKPPHPVPSAVKGRSNLMEALCQ